MIGIYKITSPTGRIYVGQSVNLKKRQREYLHLQSCKNQTKLYASLTKYGVIQHTFEVLEECQINELNSRERYWQEFYDVLGEKGLNLRLTDTQDKTGHCSEETKRKIGAANKGKKKPPRTTTHRAMLSQANLGRVPTEETRARMSRARLGKTNSDRSRQASSERWQAGGNPRAQKVLDTSTGVVYSSIKEAAKSLGIPSARLRSWLVGVVCNKSAMMLVY